MISRLSLKLKFENKTKTSLKAKATTITGNINGIVHKMIIILRPEKSNWYKKNAAGKPITREQTVERSACAKFFNIKIF